MPDLFVGHKKSHPAKLINQLQGGQDGIVFQCAPEDPELDGFLIAEIHRGVPAVAALGCFQDILGTILVLLCEHIAALVENYRVSSIYTMHALLHSNE